MSFSLTDILQRSSTRHDHLCPRQVLGARIGLAGLAALGLEAPVSKCTALVIIESDGCFADGVEAATGATVGHRTLHVNDFGKVAATFADVKTGRSVRVSPALDARDRHCFMRRTNPSVILPNYLDIRSCLRRSYCAFMKSRSTPLWKS